MDLSADVYIKQLDQSVGIQPFIYLNLFTSNDAKRRVYGKNLAKKQKCYVPCSVLFSSRYIDEKNLSSKICFRFRLIYISKFIGQYIYRNQCPIKSIVQEVF